MSPRQRPTELQRVGTSSVVRIQGTIIAASGRVRGRNIRVLVDLGSTGNHISAKCKAGLELEVQPEADFEPLKLANGSEVHAQGNVCFVLHCGDYKCKVLARVFPNLQQELILEIPWLVKANPHN